MTFDLLSDQQWTESRWYRVLSYYFGLRWNSHGVGTVAHGVLGIFAVPPDPGEERAPPTPGLPPLYSLVDTGLTDLRHRLFYGPSLIAAGNDAGYVLGQLFWHVNTETIRRTGDFFLVHAGSVATPDGDAVLLPAPSGSGKSTLVAGLVRAGFGYLSDEAAAVDPVSGNIYPYPKAISLSAAVVETLFPGLADVGTISHRQHVNPDRLRGGAIAGPSPPRYVIAHQYQPGVSTRLTPISRGSAALELGWNAMNLVVYRKRALPLLSDLVMGAECYRLIHSNLAEAVEAISQVTTSHAHAEKRSTSLEAKSPL